MKYVIIGNSAAGISATEQIRKLDKQGNITIISDEIYHTYSRPLISYYLEGKVTESNMVYRNTNFYKDNNIDTILGDKAVDIDKDSKKVVLASGKTVEYDKLLLATGSVPFVPPIDGAEGKENVFTFMHQSSAKALKKVVSAKSKVVIIGAGLIGLKAAEGLHKLTKNITVVELADRVLASILDKKSGEIIQKHVIKAGGIKIKLNTTVKKVLGDGKVESVELTDGTSLECDVLIVAIGVRPNVELAKTAGVELGRAILTSDTLMTNVKDIYAAGDCTESLDITDEKTKILALLPNAYLQGEIAGVNMAGGSKKYEGAFPMNAIGFFGLHMITAGIVNPTDDYTVKQNINSKDQTCTKFVIKDDLLKGFILIDKVDRAGIYTSLIRDKVKLSTLNKDLFKNDIGLMVFDNEVRKQKLSGGAAT